jgi:hypothetical protein
MLTSIYKDILIKHRAVIELEHRANYYLIATYNPATPKPSINDFTDYMYLEELAFENAYHFYVLINRE